MKETDIGAAVVAYLESDHWDVYQEVQVYQGGPIADIVAVCGPLVMVVECKTSMSMKLMGQAWYWRRHCNLIQIAVPHSRNGGAGRAFAESVLHERGIGKLAVHPHAKRVDNHVRPRLRRTVDTAQLRAVLAPEQKASKAGSVGGGHWTPFRRTLQQLRHHVAKHPGCTLKSAFDAITHHYSSYASGRAQLIDLIKRGVISDLRIDTVRSGPGRGTFIRLAQ